MNSLSFIQHVHSVSLEPEKVKSILSKLAEPFDPEDVSFRPQSINWKDATAQALAYADPRAYGDRLNQVVGPGNWFEIVQTNVISGFEVSRTRKIPIKEGDPEWDTTKKAGWKQTKEEQIVLPGANLVITVGVGIMGVGYHENVGQEPGDGELAATAAFAQAFKRSCSQFGLGRYFYDMPKIWAKVDTQTRQFLPPGPSIPPEFLPVYRCEETGEVIKSMLASDGKTYSVAAIVANSRSKFGGVFSAAVQKRKGAEMAARAGNRIQPVTTQSGPAPVVNGH